MSLRHVFAIVRKEIQHILRDRSTFVLVLLAPTAMMLLMSYALTVDIQHVPIAVLDYDRSPTSRDFVQQITAGDAFQSQCWTMTAARLLAISFNKSRRAMISISMLK